MIFYAGQSFSSHNGRIEYRILAGDRCDGDLVLEFRIDRGNWIMPRIEHTLILATFKGQVEENNYPQSKGYEGCWRLLKAIGNAVLCNDWKAEAKKIEGERRAKAERDTWDEMWAQPFERPELL